MKNSLLNSGCCSYKGFIGPQILNFQGCPRGPQTVLACCALQSFSWRPFGFIAPKEQVIFRRHNYDVCTRPVYLVGFL
jgi:hypothetical protein